MTEFYMQLEQEHRKNRKINKKIRKYRLTNCIFSSTIQLQTKKKRTYNTNKGSLFQRRKKRVHRRVGS